MNTVEIIQKARELISDEKNWIRGTYAAGDGIDMNPTDPDACMFCAVGAVARVIGIDGSDAEDHESVKMLDAETSAGIVTFNDNHAHAEVLSIFDRVIARAERKAA